MRRVVASRLTFAVLCAVAVLASACGEQPTPPPPEIPYDTSPDAVIVEIRIESPGQPPEYRRNALPTCTLYGNGRVVWANPLATGGEQLLEGVAGPEKVQAYFRFITAVGFFRWQNEVSANLLPPEGVESFTVVTVNLAEQTHKVSAYDSGGLPGFDDILTRCLDLVDSPTLVEPDAAWLSAIRIESDANRPIVCWPEDAPARLADVESGGPVWIEGPYAVYAWANIHETEGLPVFVEGGICGDGTEPGQVYNVIVEAPGISPFAPPRPEA